MKHTQFNRFTSLFQTAASDDDNVAILDLTFIRPLLAKNRFQDLEPVIAKASDLLSDYPGTSIRELELFLVCYARVRRE